jgi:hypothetical protein
MIHNDSTLQPTFRTGIWLSDMLGPWEKRAVTLAQPCFQRTHNSGILDFLNRIPATEVPEKNVSLLPLRCAAHSPPRRRMHPCDVRAHPSFFGITIELCNAIFSRNCHRLILPPSLAPRHLAFQHAVLGTAECRHRPHLGMHISCARRFSKREAASIGSCSCGCFAFEP